MSDSPLDEFESEAQLPAANPISLADVLALRVPVHWTEAVAVIEELCGVLTVDGDPRAIPEAESILITAQGGVLIRRGAADTQAVDAIGRMLNALLDPVTTPIPLRLFVAHSIGSDKYRSVQAFSEGLAYYGRPDRIELIQALYLRCLNSSENGTDVQQDVPSVPVQILPLPVPTEEKAAPTRRFPRWLAVAAALLVLALAPLIFLRGSGTTDLWAPVRGFGAAAAAAAANVVQKAQQFVTPSPADAKNEAEPAEPAAASRRPRRPTQQARLVVNGDARALASSADPDVVATLPSEEPSRLDPQILLPVQPGTVAEGGLAMPPFLPPVPAPVVRAADPIVYSSASLDVQPPVIYSPKLPPVPPADPYWQGTNTMELLIDESGAVQQARLTSRPIRMPDMMLLSPAKTWKFHPALKNGQPVKYRLTMSWVVAPP
jgi:hypothetical protein